MKLFKIKNTYINLDNVTDIAIREEYKMLSLSADKPEACWKIYITFTNNTPEAINLVIDLTGKEANTLQGRLDIVAGLSLSDQLPNV